MIISVPDDGVLSFLPPLLSSHELLFFAQFHRVDILATSTASESTFCLPNSLPRKQKKTIKNIDDENARR